MSLISYIYMLPFIIVHIMRSSATDFSLTDCATQSLCLDYEIKTIANEQNLCLQYIVDGDCPKSPATTELCYGCANDEIGQSIATLPQRADLCVPIDCSLSDMAQIAQFLIHDSPCQSITSDQYILKDINVPSDSLEAICYPSTNSMCESGGAFDKCGANDLTNCQQSCVWEVPYSKYCPDPCHSDIKFTVETGSNKWYLSFWVSDLCCGSIKKVEIKDGGNHPEYIKGVLNKDYGYWTFDTTLAESSAPLSVRITNSNGEVIESIDSITSVECTGDPVTYPSNNQFKCINGPNGSDSGSDSDGDGNSDSSKLPNGESKGSDSGSDSNNDGNSDSSTDGGSRSTGGGLRSKSSSSGSDSHEDRNGDGDSDSSGSSGSSSSRSSDSSSMCPCSDVNKAIANSNPTNNNGFTQAFVSENGSVNNMSIVSVVIAFVIGLLCGVLFVGLYLFMNKKKNEEIELQLTDVVVNKNNNNSIHIIDGDNTPNTPNTPNSPNSPNSNTDNSHNINPLHVN